MIDRIVSYLFGKMIETSDPNNLTIDFNDPESVLSAASVLDQHGEWDRAIELHKHVLTRWPKQHGEYARNSIIAIEEKASLGR